MLDQLPKSPLSVTDVLPLLELDDAALARTAANIAAKHQEWMPAVAGYFSAEFKRDKVSAGSLTLLETAVKPWLAETSVVELVSILSESTNAERERTAWRILASASGTVRDRGVLRRSRMLLPPPRLPICRCCSTPSRTSTRRSSTRH